MSKKYYWLKIGEFFFESDEIIYLESLEKGDTYIKIWFKILLRCLKDKDSKEYGFLRFNDRIPYDDSLLSKVLKVDINDLRVAMKYFQDLSMIEILEDKTIYIESVQKMIGKESESVGRVRKHRLKKEATNRNLPLIEDHMDRFRYGGNYYLALKRDNYKCKICGSTENICMHHIKDFDESNPETIKIDNLVVLCRSCRIKMHRNSDFRNKKMKLLHVTHEIVTCNTNKEIEEEIEVNKDIDKEKKVKFDEWWNLYNKKRGKEKARKKFYSLSSKLYKKIMIHTKLYVESTPDVMYRKDPTTYLNNECWNDEIFSNNKNKTETREQQLERIKNL